MHQSITVALARRAAAFALLALAGCSLTPERYLKKLISESAANGMTWVDDDFRLAVCGWNPKGQSFKVSRVTLTFVGDDKSGTGEADTAWVSQDSSLSSLRCEGRVAFHYKYREDTNSPPYYDVLGSIHRVGPPAAITGSVEEHAAALALDAPAVATFGDGWKLPDGAFGAAYRVNLPSANRYKVKLGKDYPAFGKPRIAAYQNHEAVKEGTSSGELGFWQLQAGPAWFFLAFPTADTVEVRVTANEKK